MLAIVVYNAFSNKITATREPTFGLCKGFIVYLDQFLYLVLWNLFVFKELYFGSVIAIHNASFYNFKATSTHGINDRSTIGEELDISNFEHGSKISKRLIISNMTSHSKLSGANFHAAPYHQAIPGFEHM